MWGEFERFITSPSGSLGMLVLQLIMLGVAISVFKFVRAGQVGWFIPGTFAWTISWLLGALPLLLVHVAGIRLLTMMQRMQGWTANIAVALLVMGCAGWTRSVVRQWEEILELLESSAQQKGNGKAGTVFQSLPPPREVALYYAGGSIVATLFLGLLGALFGGRSAFVNLSLITMVAAVAIGLWYYLLYTWYGRQHGISSLHQVVQDRFSPILESSNNLKAVIANCEAVILVKFGSMTVEMNAIFKNAKRFAEVYGKRVDKIGELAATRDESQLLAVNQLLEEPIEIREDFMQSVVQNNNNLVLPSTEWIAHARKIEEELQQLLDQLAVR